MKETPILPPLTNPSPRNCTIICDTYAVDIMPCASGAAKPFLRAHSASVCIEYGRTPEYRSESLAQELPHHLRHVRRRHHALRERRREAFFAGPLGVGVYRVRTNARIRIDLALRNRLC